MNSGHASAAVILVAVSIVPALMLVDYVRGQPTPELTAAPDLYEDVPYDATLLRLDKWALDEAYHDQVKKLFAVWVSSGAPTEATHLKNGLRIARRAYSQASQQITKREQEGGQK